MKKFNLLILELICGIALFATIFSMAITGAYKDYVTPKMMPYLFFVCFVLAVWIGYDIYLLIKKHNHSHITNSLLFAVPVAIILVSLPLATKVKSNGVSVEDSTQATEASDYEESSYRTDGDKIVESNESKPEIKANDSSKASVCDKINRLTEPYKPEGKQNTILYGYDKANNTLIISDEEFSGWLDETMNNIEKYVGVKVTVKGQVLTDPEFFGDGEFSPVRQLMTCCVADLAPIGYLCHYDNIGDFNNDDWVEVTGTFIMGEYQGQQDLQIQVENVKPANPSTEKYVYPVH